MRGLERMWAKWAALAAAVGVANARCLPGGRPVSSANGSYVDDGGESVVQRRIGLQQKDWMPSAGDLYYTQVKGSKMACYAGSPIGYVTAGMCCELSESGVCASTDFLKPEGGSFVTAIGDIANIKDDVNVPVKVDYCSTPTMLKAEGLKRDALEMEKVHPPAVPYEFVSPGKSACDCRNDRLELHVDKQNLGSADFTAWQDIMNKKLNFFGTRPAFNAGTSGGTCMFVNAGYGFEGGRATVPLIPSDKLNPKGRRRLKADVATGTIPFIEGKALDLPCGGEFDINLDVNYCFHDERSDNTPRYVPQKRVNKLAEFCARMDTTQEKQPEDVLKASRCCMKMTIEGTETQTLYTIKADVFASAACRKVNEAVNNGDGKMHAEMPGPMSSLSEMHNRGRDGGLKSTIGLLYTDLDVPTDQFRSTVDKAGFHAVCVLEEDIAARCTAYNSVPAVDHLERIENTCIIPERTITGEPTVAIPEYAASLYNMHAQSVAEEYTCKDPDAIATLITAQTARGTACEKLKSWSKMNPGVYYRDSGIPLPSARFLGKGCEFDSAAVERVNPGGQLKGLFTCKKPQNAALDSAPRETVSPASSSTAPDDAWQKIISNCGQNDGCKTTPQYSYQSETYTKQNRAPFPVLTEKETCVNKARNPDDSSVTMVIVDGAEHILFTRAAPRVVGIVHPIYEGGGYLGGTSGSPGRQYNPGEPTTEDFVEEEIWVTEPSGESAAFSVLSNPPFPGEITSITGALVIDDRCRVHNYRGARELYDGNGNTAIPIAGQFPRFMDIGMQKSHRDRCSAEGVPSQQVGAQTFFDLYGRGGAVPDPPREYALVVNNILASSPVVCATYNIGGCLDKCDRKKYDAAVAASTTAEVLGIATGVLGLFSRSPLTAVGGGALGVSAARGRETIEMSPEGAATLVNIDSNNAWLTLARGIFAFANPVAKHRARFVRDAYNNYPSNLAAVEDPNIRPDRRYVTWVDGVQALPAQTLAAQLGCRTAATNGQFKRELSRLDNGAHLEIFHTTQVDSDEEMAFTLVGKDKLPWTIEGTEGHFVLQKDDKTYTPARDEELAGCGLCTLYTPVPDYIYGQGWATPQVEGCNFDGHPMRYSLGANENLQNEALAMTWSEIGGAPTKVTLEYGYLIGNGKVMVWTDGGDETDRKSPQIMVQRLLGRNLTSPRSPLTEPLCVGDASSELGVCHMAKSLHQQWDHAITCKDHTKSFTQSCINPVGHPFPPTHSIPAVYPCPVCRCGRTTST